MAPEDYRARAGSLGDGEVTTAVRARYSGLEDASARLAYSSVHEVYEVIAGDRKYALKLYRANLRTNAEVEWETGLHNHLAGKRAPVSRLVAGRNGFSETFVVEGRSRLGVMSEWASGQKPKPSQRTYWLLGEAAARMHDAFDSYTVTSPKPAQTFDTEVTQMLALLQPVLEGCGRWHQATWLAEVIAGYLERHHPERAVCHNDLTLDNVHVSDDRLTIFDFDSARLTWRAVEPQGVYQFAKQTGEPYWDAWLEGYQSVRGMPGAEQRAVPYLVALYGFENLAWKLGLTKSSDGQHVQEEDVPRIVDEWLTWAHDELGAVRSPGQ